MLDSLRKAKNEEGFTLIELLVVILIIGILAAIAIPMFLNQRKAAVDSSVKSDLNNAAKVAQDWMIKNPTAIIEDEDITYKSSQASGPVAGNAAFISTASTLAKAIATPLETAATPNLKLSEQVRVSPGTTLKIRGTANIGEFCIYGINSGGDESSVAGRYFWDSNSGGLNTKEGVKLDAKAACPRNADNTIAPPAAPATTPPATGGSTGGAIQPPMSSDGSCPFAKQEQIGTWRFATSDGNSITASGSIQVNDTCTSMQVRMTDQNWSADTPHFAILNWKSTDNRGMEAARGFGGLDFKSSNYVSTDVSLNNNAEEAKSWASVEIVDGTDVNYGSAPEAGIYYLYGTKVVFDGHGGSRGSLAAAPAAAPAASTSTVDAQNPSMPLTLNATNRSGNTIVFGGDFGINDSKNATWGMYVDAGNSTGLSTLTNASTGSINFRVSYDRGNTMAPPPAGTTKTEKLDLANGSRYVAGSSNIAALIDAAKTDPGYSQGSPITVYADITVSSTADPYDRSAVSYSNTVQLGVAAQ